jgi:peptide deformylase
MIITDQSVLKQSSVEIEYSNKELITLIIELLEQNLKNSKIPGVGLSAIQIGIPLQVAIVRTANLKLNLYNTKIINMRNPFIFKNEGCLSIPNIFKDTKRFNLIEIENGDGQIFKLAGYEAVVVQHELNHFKGELFLNYSIN